jgi:hypothetical protein
LPKDNRRQLIYEESRRTGLKTTILCLHKAFETVEQMRKKPFKYQLLVKVHCSNSAEEITKDVMLIIFIYIYKLIICKIQIINCKGAYRNAEWGERPADTGPGMEMYPAMYRDLRIRALAWKCIQQCTVETCGYGP